MYIYKSREKGSVDISRKIKTLEKIIATSDTGKLKIYNKKCEKSQRTIKI